LNDGDDKAIVKGECNYSPVVRVIGDKGKDEFIDESKVHGYFLSITPFPAIQKRTIFYDSDDNTKVEFSEGTVYDNSYYKEPENDGEKYEPQKIDRSHNWLLIPILSYDSDAGLTFGGGIQLDKFNFRMDPLEYRQSIFGSYATNTQSFSFGYQGDFYAPINDGRINLIAAYTEQFTTRYFGYGNETKYDSEAEENDLYEVNQSLTTIFPTLFYSFSENVVGSFGISFIQTNTEVEDDSLLSGFSFGNYGLGKLNPLGFHLEVNIDERKNINFPTNGFYISGKATYYPAVFNVPTPFYTSNFDLRGYITPEKVDDLTIASRIGGGISWGTYPFFAGAAIGGLKSLRGYNNKRFSGDAAIFGQLEFRYFVTPINLILKSKLGINVFAETGRVFAKNENSSRWHPSYG
ncbi:MAG: BamA/TamA family outer membrane protein, partial [Nitrososphaeraceae archaeon]|nr:BamA/TamA family outer membrane protein [Nitrososphaeraceae archaeon]